jgi:ATP synthase protein I
MSEKPGDHETSFEERLAMARDKQGLEAARPGPGKRPDGLDGSALAIGVRVGVEMVSALVVAVAIGWGLDWLFGTRPILMAVFVLLGGAAGVLNVWRMFAPKRGPAPGKPAPSINVPAKDGLDKDRGP